MIKADYSRQIRHVLKHAFTKKGREVIMNDEIKLTEEQEKEFANGKGDDEE